MQTRRTAFTLIEMTIVIAIIAILAAMSMSVYATALQQSKVHRTRAIIAKLDHLIGEKYESYRTRQVPIRIPPLTNPSVAAQARLYALRELMRMEMPDRQSDILPYDALSTTTLSGEHYYLPAAPSLAKTYRRRASAGWTATNENSECLYLILAAMRDGDKSALDYFSTTEIGDTDQDGMREILDAWGQPIGFFRWPAGYRSDVAPFPVTPQNGADVDPFDPFKVDARFRDNVTTNDPIALKPLIWSAGPDKKHDIWPESGLIYSATLPPNDPYYVNGSSYSVGSPFDADGDGMDNTDNITNHDLEAR